MTCVTATNATSKFSLKAYRGDRKTLLAFNLPKAQAKNLAGFSIQVQPPTGPAYYLDNTLRFDQPADHAQDAAQSANSSLNAPFQKFRWVHVPGQTHQGLDPQVGTYAYTVTPRYFDKDGSLLPLDAGAGATAKIDVDAFEKGALKIGFTRGYMQSQAFVNHFGKAATVRPAGKTLIYDTSAQAGVNAAGDKSTYAQEYAWMGYTARELVFEVLKAVQSDASLTLDMFAYDLNEPDVITILQALAKDGRLRMILDNASLHHASPPKPEDQVETLLNKAKAGIVLRGKFGRYAHDKVMIVYQNKKPVRVLTGSTNFSVTGLYVNANHVLVYEDAEVAGWYAGVFEESWTDKVNQKAFAKSVWATKSYTSSGAATPKTEFNFSPHSAAYMTKELGGIVNAVAQQDKAGGSVLFAVMELTSTGKSKNAVYSALDALHAKTKAFTYGISDAPEGIYLYPHGSTTGVLVTGKPGATMLPPPFNQVPGIAGHEIHDKFVVCGFNRPEAVVYCGSSNLAEGGEQANGDNLLAIRDGDVATVFAIEALLLIDHYDFLDRYATKTVGKSKTKKAKAVKSTVKNVGASKTAAAAAAGMFLDASDDWTDKFYDGGDLHATDRQLFG
ncbi:MAG TPA: phospholipase D-like domain-containing protein [Caulobacteraceae bacterium]|jgi:hypothetical protein